MTVQQLIQALSGFPAEATVLLEGDSGYSPLGSLNLVDSGLVLVEGGLMHERALGRLHADTGVSSTTCRFSVMLFLVAST